jgi:uncharacterized protein
MTCKRLATLALLLVSCISALGQGAAYPARRGIVSDYAGRLNRAQIDELTALIQQYERQTSIEFAVVVVNSLHGQSAREYAVGIGDAWGVGKAGRNNGIVLLWAPNEPASRGNCRRCAHQPRMPPDCVLRIRLRKAVLA